MLIIFDFYNTTFLNQVVADFEKLQYIQFYNLSGKSFSKSFQIEFNYKASIIFQQELHIRTKMLEYLIETGLKENH